MFFLLYYLCFSGILFNQRNAKLFFVRKWLSHLLEPAFCFAHRFLNRQVAIAILQIVSDPFGQFLSLISLGKALIGKAHDTIVIFASQSPADTLCRMSHRIKGQKIALINVVHLPQKFQTSSQNRAQSVHIRYADHDYASA
ncbi:hypothetical protein BpHYR1_043222 [Brachionus plicatilis]|uniref:Uncharacterized protein n=1 Tax=Brachionus plicatilis TaxID=10195 RepID=A0A3M7QQ34_BRAPC|nr:hypothetical protein BpHYR1_043222 [Brachionus plicatilis]